MENSQPQPSQPVIPQHSRKLLIILGIVLVSFCIGVGGASLFFINSQRNTKTEKTVTVTGTGIVEIKADEASIASTLRDVSSAYFTYISAEDAGRKKAQEYRQKLIDLGVSETAISAESYGDAYQNTNQFPYESEENVRYYTTVTIIVNLKKDQFDLIGKIVPIFDSKMRTTVDYYATPTQEDKSIARANALKDAKKQIEDMQSIGDVKVKSLISVKDLEKNKDSYYPLEGKIYVEKGSSGVKYSTSLEVAYSLK